MMIKMVFIVNLIMMRFVMVKITMTLTIETNQPNRDKMKSKDDIHSCVPVAQGGKHLLRNWFKMSNNIGSLISLCTYRFL